jgi:hypothetical protein
MRKKFVELCKDELLKNPNSFVLLGDIGVGGFLDKDDNLFDRVINMGIAEQALVGFGAGLSSSLGGNVILHTISSFLVERAFEQIKLCCGYNENKLILISANGPFDYEKLGPTHHCPADIDVLSTIPNLELRVPATLNDFCDSFNEAIKSKKSFYIRMTSRIAEIPIKPIDDEGWKKIYLVDGEFHDTHPEQALIVILCIGEALAYCVDRFRFGSYAIYWTANPHSSPPSSILKALAIRVYEPYLRSTIDLDEVVSIPLIRKNFKRENKKIILKNLGWEDFDD